MEQPPSSPNLPSGRPRLSTVSNPVAPTPSSPQRSVVGSFGGGSPQKLFRGAPAADGPPSSPVMGCAVAAVGYRGREKNGGHAPTGLLPFPHPVIPVSLTVANLPLNGDSRPDNRAVFATSGAVIAIPRGVPSRLTPRPLVTTASVLPTLRPSGPV